MHRKLFSLLLVVALILPACSPGAPEPGNLPPPVSASGSETLALTAPPAANEPTETAASPPEPVVPNPLNVTVVLSGEVTKAVPTPEGATIDVVDGRGVRYTLTIPPGALLSDQDVRLTPVASIDGLPMSGGLAAAIQLEPEGLFLLQPATLTITVPEGFAAGELIAFAYAGSGQELHLYPAQVDENGLTFQISHFSGYGSGAGTQADRGGMQGNPPSSGQAQAHQKAADAINRAKESGSGIPYDELELILREWFNNSVYPNLKAAESDDTKIDAAGAEFLTWEHDLSFFGMEDRFAAERSRGYKSFEKGLKNAYKKAFERCVDKPDVYEATRMVQRLRQIAVMGGTGGFDLTGYSLRERTPDFQKCMAFTLEFASLVTWEVDENMQIYTQMGATVPLVMDENWRFNGSGSLLHVDHEFTLLGSAAAMMHACKQGVVITDATLTVENAQIDWKNLNSVPSAQVVMPINPGSPNEQLSLDCSSNPLGGYIDLNLPEIPTWMMGFDSVHKSKKVESWGSSGADAYVFTSFDLGSGRLFARYAKTETAQVTGSTFTDDLTMDLLHTPE